MIDIILGYSASNMDVQMFIEIAPHTGVYYSEVFNPKEVSPSEESVSLLDNHWFQNLDYIDQVIPGVVGISDSNFSESSPKNLWAELEGMQFLYFSPARPPSAGDVAFTLIFASGSKHEIIRLKRAILGEEVFASQG